MAASTGPVAGPSRCRLTAFCIIAGNADRTGGASGPPRPTVLTFSGSNDDGPAGISRQAVSALSRGMLTR
jgi:hypothetical protein